MSVSTLPQDTVFSGVSRYILPRDNANVFELLAVMNSRLCEGFLRMLTPDRDRIPGTLRQLPIELSESSSLQHPAQVLHHLKATWDTGNEICTRFDAPWLAQARRSDLLPAFQDLHPTQAPAPNLQSLLDYARAVEDKADACLQALQAEIDETVYDLYEISAEDRALIERELGDRPQELVWPQMERKSNAEKRREHVRRLVSWCLLETLRADPDGILTMDEAVAGIRDRLEAEFGEEAAFRMEADIKGVLGPDLVGWLDGPFVQWHTKLYKKTPIVWHLASADSARTLNLFLYYHKLDGDTLRKVQTLYLWPAKRRQESLRSTAQARNDPADIETAELALEALEAFEGRLLSVIQTQVACEPPDWAEGPFRGGLYDPVLDDGVKVNLLPLQEAGLLRYRKVV